ncbi:thioredoxin family protein [Oxalobacter sp. OttesenSCG-928-P03]|nr:thioredoxin family protein [Oxalobacter sp. OttesenSCG-928-P03]
MSLVTLKSSDYAELLDSLDDGSWIFVCLCADWCGSCREYRPQLESLAAARKDVRFFWVDIEDHGDMLGDLDVDKFPTILIQKAELVAFYSCIHPDAKLAERILQSMMDESPEKLHEQAQSSDERRMWQKDCSFRTMLQNGLDAAA